MAAGFHPGVRGTQGGDALREFVAAVAAAPVGTHFETGIMWDHIDGWCPYQRIGDKALKLSPNLARRIAGWWETRALKEPISPTRDWALDTAKTLREIATECERNTRDGKKPDGWQVAEAPEGST
jgi:hypothetical protein